MRRIQAVAADCISPPKSSLHINTALSIVLQEKIGLTFGLTAMILAARFIPLPIGNRQGPFHEKRVYVPKDIFAFRLLACCFFVILARLTDVHAHDVGSVQPLRFVGYAAPFGNDKSTTYTDVWGEGDIAVIGSLESGVAILDISTPGPVTHVGTFDPVIPRQFQDVKASGDFGYFSGADGGGTFVVDLTNPATPALVSQIDSSMGGHENVRNAALSNDYLYQANENSGVIHVFDISSPFQPQFVRSIDTGDSIGIYDITLAGSRMYASGLGGNAGAGAVYVYDIANLSATTPMLLSQVPTGANTSSSWASMDGNTLVVTHRQVGGSLGVWDISDLNQPTLATTADASELGLNSFSASEVVLLDDILYVAWWEAGVQVLDLDSNLINNGVQLIGQFDTSNFSSPLDGFAGNQSVFPLLGHDRVLLGDSRWGFHMVDSEDALPLLPSQGNFDGDADVDGTDFLAWQRGVGLGAVVTGSDGDANRDGEINVADLDAWSENYGSPTVFLLSTTVTIPEPSSRALAGFVAAAFLLLYHERSRKIRFVKHH